MRDKQERKKTKLELEAKRDNLEIRKFFIFHFGFRIS
jgi:hypothetical protein